MLTTLNPTALAIAIVRLDASSDNFPATPRSFVLTFQSVRTLALSAQSIGSLMASNAGECAILMLSSYAGSLPGGVRPLVELPVDQTPRQFTQTRETQFTAVGDDLHRPGQSPRQTRMTPVNTHHIAFRHRGLMRKCPGFPRWIHAPTVGQASLPIAYPCANKLRIDGGQHGNVRATVAAGTGCPVRF